MLNTLLRDSDVMSMAHGLELRVPLIDHVLADKLMALPGDWKMDGNVPKPLLVHALKGALPDDIVHRKKQGFTLPFERWLRENLRPEVEARPAKIGRGPLGSCSIRSVRRVWGDFLKRRTSWSRVWSLYVLQRWCELNSSFGVRALEERHKPRGDSHPRLSSRAKFDRSLAARKDERSCTPPGRPAPRAAVSRCHTYSQSVPCNMFTAFFHAMQELTEDTIQIEAATAAVSIPVSVIVPGAK